MNKYQEALNYLIENIEMLNRHSDGSFCQPYSSKNTLQELVDKATLKKPLIAFADGVTADGSIVQKTALVCLFLQITFSRKTKILSFLRTSD